MKNRDIFALAGFVVVCLLIAAIGAKATVSSVDDWYVDLDKPSWNPPNAIFGPVWTVLFVMMGVAAWLVWRQRERARVRPALALWVVQLALNLAWSLIFFGLQLPGPAAVEIVLLWLAIVATLVAFTRVSKAAAWLLVPYLAWVSFAAVLNVTIWRLNA